jgi:hypothetical protein
MTRQNKNPSSLRSHPMPKLIKKTGGNSSFEKAHTSLGTGTIVPTDMQQLTNEMMENYNRRISQWVEFSNEAMQCHTLPEIAVLGTKVVEYARSDYANETMKFFQRFTHSNAGLPQLCGFTNASTQICEALGA